MATTINKIRINQIPEDVHTEIGKCLNNRSLYNLMLSSKYNFNTQKRETQNRYKLLLDKYNREEIIKKYCKVTSESESWWYINIFLKIKNEHEHDYEIICDAVKDLHNIIKLINAGYTGYKKYTTDMIFILMPWTHNNPRLLYFLKKMLKCRILNTNVTNMCGVYPIEHAIAYNNYDAVKILVEDGNGLKPITNSKLDLLISMSNKTNGYIYTYLCRYK
jgi:hypothetical protein